MNTKLTLNLDKEIIEEAKTYARDKHTSLSKLIETYLNSLTRQSSGKSRISPLVKSLTGVLPHELEDDKKAYRDHLSKKYL